jgi:hypothetical protein
MFTECSLNGTKQKRIRSVDVTYTYPAGTIDEVSVKRYPESVSNFFFLGYRWLRGMSSEMWNRHVNVFRPVVLLLNRP